MSETAVNSNWHGPIADETWISVINSQMKGTGLMHISQTWHDNENRVALEKMKAEVDRLADCWQRHAC